MKVIDTEKSPIKMWVDSVPVEDHAIEQLKNIASLPFIYKHVAVMPDVHLGKGATVGSVIPTIGAVIPAAVGVDIGCGMCAVPLNLTAKDLPDDLKSIRDSIESTIPVGFNAYEDRRKSDHLLKEEAEAIQGAAINQICEMYRITGPKQGHFNQLGTLGGGNHFIELCLDELDRVWVMLHSGSRGIGNRIGQRFIELAKQDMEKYFITLPDGDLSYFPENTEHFAMYCMAVEWAQKYAAMNRKVMLRRILECLKTHFPQLEVDLNERVVNCHHNYVSREHHFGKNIIVTRKGAVSAKEGELGIIPGSMGARSFIVRGKGNEESFHSCSHGAGRKMSRGEAKRSFTLADHIEATKSVECRKDENVIDETPGAYKDIDAVMMAQRDLVDIVHTLKQVVCVKG